tara:strand:- start:5076 stop:5273 length:198 start_codon:yes stop_codon:yes gene_type:complete
MVMGANKKEFENERQEREYNEFSNIVKKQKGYMSFKNIINLVNMFPNNTELGQRVREYVASRDNE